MPIETGCRERVLRDTRVCTKCDIAPGMGSNTHGQIQIRGPKKYQIQIQICELENIQIQIQIHLFKYKYKYNTLIYRFVFAGVYDIPPIA